MGRPPPRRIRRLLVANRGEIAQRILTSARELGIETYSTYTTSDILHTKAASHAVKLASPASYVNIAEIIQICKKHSIDTIHPGYGFLSESGEFSRRCWQEGIVVVGPGWDILDRTGDKLEARRLAAQCDVPVLPALHTPTNDVDAVRAFASSSGYPIMVKAVDGGGGRGIRLIRSVDQLDSAARRAIEESPSKQIFAEKAAVNGFLHVEVQIVGDGNGQVRHVWERQCSIQRRYQKVVEVAPCISAPRPFVNKIIESAMKMASAVNYFSLGTFEFLANPRSQEFYFLEINPRLQVEHTITEQISSIDLVRAQLLLSQGASLAEGGITKYLSDPNIPPPTLFSAQFRITSENVAGNWSLSIGKINSVQFPSGNGIRVDTALIPNRHAVVGSDFDSLQAKLIVTAATWDAVVRKARIALEDTRIAGIRTNLDILRGIAAHSDFSNGDCDTRWLESNQAELLRHGESLTSSLPSELISVNDPSAYGSLRERSDASAAAAAGGGAPLFRKGDAWTLQLTPLGANADDSAPPHHIQLTRIQRNAFPQSLAAELTLTTPADPRGRRYALAMQATSASAAAATAGRRRADPRDPTHVANPFAGTLVEVCVDVGDDVAKDDVVAVVRQMKMELEIRARAPGRVEWVTDAEDGEDVAEGMLVAVIAAGERAQHGDDAAAAAAALPKL